MNGVPARVWEGQTVTGIPVTCLITRIAVAGDADVAQFEAELRRRKRLRPRSKRVRCGWCCFDGGILEREMDRCGGVIEPGSAEWHERKRQLLAAEKSQPADWWYLSFADEGGFLGACVLRAPGMATAIQRSHQLGINPGGQVAGFDLGPELPPAVAGIGITDRLLSKAELEAIDK